MRSSLTREMLRTVVALYRWLSSMAAKDAASTLGLRITSLVWSPQLDLSSALFLEPAEFSSLFWPSRRD